ncbi:DDE_3 domain-containing protein [Trichonephila clavipes]|nr:DDE_3 domain-containing protein [Trichonephila clavipes]
MNLSSLDTGGNEVPTGRLHPPRCTISRDDRWTVRMGDTGFVERKPEQGCPRTMTDREDRHLPIIVTRTKGTTSSQLSRELGTIDPDFILMDNSVRTHTDQLVKDFLESEDIRRINWSVRSPDLIPIEHT